MKLILNWLGKLTKSRESIHPLFREVQQLKRQLITQELLFQQDAILFELVDKIRNSLDLDTILQTTVNEIHALLQVDRCHFVWCLPQENHFSLTVTHEATKVENLNSLGELLVEPDSILIEAIINLKILRLDNISTTPTALTPLECSLFYELDADSLLLTPIKTHSGQLGAIICYHERGSCAWIDREVQLLKAIADRVALALDQAELLAQTQAAAFAAQSQAAYLSDALKQLQQTQMQLVQQEKMSSLGQLVAGVAHEINNPVNFIHGNIAYANAYVRELLELLSLYREVYPNPPTLIQTKQEVIDLDFLAEDLPRLLSSMQMGAERISQIVRSLRNFSRLDEAGMKPVDIHEGIDNSLLILKSRLNVTKAKCKIQVVKKYGDLPPVECYAGQLNQVFMNILVNAIDALDTTVNPTLTIQTEFLKEGNNPDSDSLPASQKDSILVRISDNGSGMTEATQQQLFNPFFTTKPIGKGTGLGLSISYQIVVEKHGGILKCSSESGKGSEFWIQIPVQPLVKIM